MDLTVKDSLEPLGRRDEKVGLRFSLRGSLAPKYVEIKLAQGEEAAAMFINNILTSGNLDIASFLEGNILVIGRRSEIGKYFPDW